jgi:hypothetical protein
MGNGNSVVNKNMAKLAAGLAEKRYTELLKDVDLSNLIYLYSKKDEQVGALSEEEISFLKSKKVKILVGEKKHIDNILENIKKAVEFLDL